MVRRLTASGVVVLGLALLSGCGAQARGSLVVGIQYTGGAWPVSGQLLAGRVAVFDEHGHRARVVHVKAGETAKVALPPGRYSLGLGHGRPTVKQLQGCRPKSATVTGNRTTNYTLQLGCWPSTPKGVLASIAAAALSQKSVHFSESFAADLYGTDHRTFDVSAHSGTELITYYGSKMRMLLVDHTVYVRGDAGLLSGTYYSPGLDLTRAQVRRYAGKWISIPKGDKDYAGLAAGLTLGSIVLGITPESGFHLKLKALRTKSRTRLLEVQGTPGPETVGSYDLRARGTGTPLPVSFFVDPAGMNMVFYNATYSRWNEPVNLQAPANSTPISTVLASSARR